MPSDPQWTAFAKLLREKPGEVMLWEDELLPEVRERLQNMGVPAVVFRPCVNSPTNEDFLAVMGENLDRLAQKRN